MAELSGYQLDAVLQEQLATYSSETVKNVVGVRLVHGHDLTDVLDAVRRAEGQDRFAVLSPKWVEGYVQCLFASDELAVLCEVASGVLGPEEGMAGYFRLIPEATAALHRLGFGVDDPDNNHQLVVQLANVEDVRLISELMLTALTVAYGTDAEIDIIAPRAPPLRIREAQRREKSRQETAPLPDEAADALPGRSPAPKRLVLKSASVDELVVRFVEIALAQKDAIENGEVGAYNKLFGQMQKVVTELRSRPGDERRQLVRLFAHASPMVRLKAAFATLALVAEAADVLHQISNWQIYPESAEAAGMLSALRDGRFQPE